MFKNILYFFLATIETQQQQNTNILQHIYYIQHSTLLVS